jgi:hypothetical protein
LRLSAHTSTQELVSWPRRRRRGQKRKRQPAQRHYLLKRLLHSQNQNDVTGSFDLPSGYGTGYDREGSMETCERRVDKDENDTLISGTRDEVIAMAIKIAERLERECGEERFTHPSKVFTRLLGEIAGVSNRVY